MKAQQRPSGRAPQLACSSVRCGNSSSPPGAACRAEGPARRDGTSPPLRRLVGAASRAQVRLAQPDCVLTGRHVGDDTAGAARRVIRRMRNRRPPAPRRGAQAKPRLEQRVPPFRPSAGAVPAPDASAGATSGRYEARLLPAGSRLAGGGAFLLDDSGNMGIFSACLSDSVTDAPRGRSLCCRHPAEAERHTGNRCRHRCLRRLPLQAWRLAGTDPNHARYLLDRSCGRRCSRIARRSLAACKKASHIRHLE